MYSQNITIKVKTGNPSLSVLNIKEHAFSSVLASESRLVMKWFFECTKLCYT